MSTKIILVLRTPGWLPTISHQVRLLLLRQLFRNIAFKVTFPEYETHLPGDEAQYSPSHAGLAPQIDQRSLFVCAQRYNRKTCHLIYLTTLCCRRGEFGKRNHTTGSCWTSRSSRLPSSSIGWCLYRGGHSGPGEMRQLWRRRCPRRPMRRLGSSHLRDIRMDYVYY